MSEVKNKIRDSEREAILIALLEHHPMRQFPEIVMELIAKRLESSVYNASIDKAKEKGIQTTWRTENFIAQYASIGYTFKINLDVNSSVNRDRPENVRKHVAQKICNYITWSYCKHLNVLPAETMKYVGEFLTYFNPCEVGNLSSYELNPYINEPYVQQISIREQQEAKKKYSTMYKCSRCGEKKTIFYEIQTCSLDEGGTQFIECLNCGKVWRSYQ